MTDMIPLAEVLAMVREAAKDNEWCDQAEEKVEAVLGVKMIRWPERCCDTCYGTYNEWWDAQAEMCGPRFTPVDDFMQSKEIHKTQLARAIRLSYQNWGAGRASVQLYRALITKYDLDKMDNAASGLPGALLGA